MLKGLFGSFGGIVSSFTHGVKARAESVLEATGLLQGAGIDISEELVGQYVDQWQDLNTFKNALESISEDQLIPGSFMKQRDSVLQSKFEYIIKASYINPEGDLEDVHMTIASDQRLTQGEIVGSDLITQCQDILGVDVEGLEWDIIEGYLSK